MRDEVWGDEVSTITSTRAHTHINTQTHTHTRARARTLTVVGRDDALAPDVVPDADRPVVAARDKQRLADRHVHAAHRVGVIAVGDERPVLATGLHAGNTGHKRAIKTGAKVG